MLLDAVLERVKTMPGEALRVVDPEGLVMSIPVIEALGDVDVEVMAWEEPLQSRLAWEQPIPAGGRLVVVSQAHRSTSLPADVLNAATREVVVSGSSLFDPIDSSVIEQLDWADRARAYEVARELDGRRLDRKQSATQLLRRLYRLDPDATRGLEQTLEVVLRHHLRARAIPMSSYLADVFAESVGDPLPGILTRDALVDREGFLAWLDGFWLQATTSTDGIQLLRAAMSTGPRELLDDYFERGYITPVPAEAAIAEAPFGIDIDPDADRARRLDAGLGSAEAALAAGFEAGTDWSTIASEWADVLVAQFTSKDQPAERFKATRLALNEAFVSWASEHYGELISLPVVTHPPMVHHANRYIERHARDEKVALVVVDGLSLGVWRLLSSALRQADWHIREMTSFAWIPTITSISRQAIFSGKTPMFFASSIGSLAQEQSRWNEWWGSQKFAAHEIGYTKMHLADTEAEGGIEADADFLDALGRRVLGFVVRDVDHQVHHETLHEAVLYASLVEWQRQGHLAKLLDILLDEGYAVFLTSDHGFVGVKSIGVWQDGVTAHQHGRFERFTDQTLYQKATEKHAPECRAWTNDHLPDDYLALLAPTLGAMKPKGSHLTAHGGATLEEVVVPWVEIRR